jgi:hypothetical protein
MRNGSLHAARTALGLVLSLAYGGICGAICGAASGDSIASGFGFFFGVIAGLFCFPFLAWFFNRGHTVIHSLLAVLLPSATLAGIGGAFNIGIGFALSVIAYALLASNVNFPGCGTDTPRFAPGHCQHCGYNRTGIAASARCPECGGQ